MNGRFLTTVAVKAEAGVLLAPVGLSTPHAISQGCHVTGGTVRDVLEAPAGTIRLHRAAMPA